MAKYSKKAADKVEKVMHEFKEGKLRSGSGDKVKSRKQAIAIGLSEAREAGAKVPKKTTSKSSSTKKPATGTKAKSSTKKEGSSPTTRRSATKKNSSTSSKK